MNDEINPKQVSPERLVRVETQVAGLSRDVHTMSNKLTDVDETLQAIGQHLAQISARPEVKGFSENIKTISTTASVVVVLCGAVWWAISVSTNPLSKAITTISATQQAEHIANVEARVHLEYTIKRLENLELLAKP